MVSWKKKKRKNKHGFVTPISDFQWPPSTKDPNIFLYNFFFLFLVLFIFFFCEGHPLRSPKSVIHSKQSFPFIFAITIKKYREPKSLKAMESEILYFRVGLYFLGFEITTKSWWNFWKRISIRLVFVSKLWGLLDYLFFH